MKNIAIIGANWGDESKGRSVDYFAKSIENGLVVRFSGSNNAAHTVWKDNKRFVFNLVGSGTLRDVPTYLSRHVHIDVVALYNEIANLKLHGYNPTVYVDPRCKIVTPYDVMINRVDEVSRGDNKHGSTGNGLNQAIKRGNVFPLVICQFELSYKVLQLIQKQFKTFVDSKIGMFNNLSKEDIDFIHYLYNENSVNDIYNNINSIIKDNLNVQIVDLKKYNCIFEGSQGLALDEYYGKYPYTTRGRTGSTNLIDICREYDIEIDTIYYVSRTYLTRHGFDPNFKIEDISESIDVIDETNVFNKWQDNLKTGWLNLDDMDERIKLDSDIFKINYPNTKVARIFSCLDQIKSMPYVYYDDELIKVSFKSFIYTHYSNVMFFDNKENI